MNGRNVRLGSRAFDILEVLIAAQGALVSKQQILDKVWPDSAVSENNLQVHITALRKLFGENRGLIKTVPGRGYHLVSRAVPIDTSPEQAAVVEYPSNINLPALSSPLFGRETAKADVSALLQKTRLLTLVGSGGIGKTRLAIEVARDLGCHFPDGVQLISLTSAADLPSVLDTFAKALGTRAINGISALAEWANNLGHRRVLFVLDNCEHVLGPAADLVETVLRHGTGACFLATSREAIRSSHETSYTVPPLDFPAHSDATSEVLQSSAVKLFLSRARAADPRFSLDAQGISLTGTLCRRLDGIPLAIELAAARAAILGIHALVANLDDRFRMLTGGHPTALPGHQTLKATLDWSYALLEEHERMMLRRLGIFVNGFTIDGVLAVMTGDSLDESEVIDALGGLVAKSLVIVDSHASRRRYRLLETTRAYALQKLDDHGEFRLTANLHARHLTDLFRRCKTVLVRSAASRSGKVSASL